MALPNLGMDAVPFTPLTAEFLDDMIENIESLAGGTGLNDRSVSLPKIDGGATAGVLHTNASGVVSAAGAWTSWTPTLTNITTGNGTVVARYSQIGKTVNYRFSFTMGTTSAMGTVPKFSLPVAAAAITGTSNGIVIGRGSIWDFGTNNFDVVVLYETTTIAAIRVINAAATNSVQSTIMSTNPMTWASTDEIHISGTYEAA